MAEAAAGVLYAVEKAVEGAVVAAKGIYDPTLPLKATLVPITSVSVPLAYHTISVVKGRAYLFGGKGPKEEGNGEELADNGMHIVILPSSGVESTDYQKIEPSEEAPPRRYGHCAAVIEDRIYVFGGCGEDGEPLEENGRLWVYSCETNQWSHFDPPTEGKRPEARSCCASVASEHPRPVRKKTQQEQQVDVLPQDPPDPEITLPEIEDADTYGTVIVQGGQGKNGTPLNDLWTFDISTRTWTELPEPPPPTTSSPSLAIVDNRLYTFSAGQTSYLDLDKSASDDRWGVGELGIAPLGPWQLLPTNTARSSPENPWPGERKASPLIPVTTGQGRNYLLLVGGQSDAGGTEEDMWILQLKPEDMTAASFKDAARMAVKMNTDECKWEEVKYLNADRVMIQEGQAGRGIGIRKGLAVAKESEVDGASALIWGGIGDDGRVRGDGLMVTVDT